IGQMSVAGQTVGGHELGLAGATGYGGLARVALERVRRLELLEVVADLSGNPGGEAVTEAGEAQVDLAVRELLPQLVSLGLMLTPVAPGAQQELSHSALPGPPLLTDQEQLLSGQPDAVGLGPDQARAGREVAGGEGLVDPLGKALGPAVVVGAREGDQFLRTGGCQRLMRRPALQQPKLGGRGEVVAGDLESGREGVE